jgi:uncharacterized protein
MNDHEQRTVGTIRIARPSAQQLEALGIDTWSRWSCEASTFEWTYEADESAYILEGRVRVHVPHGEPVELGRGDLVTFPAGLNCTWEVIEPVRKVYTFERID